MTVLFQAKAYGITQDSMTNMKNKSITTHTTSRELYEKIL